MSHHPVWGLAFRPFFLMGSLIGAVLVLFWALSFFKGDLPTGIFDPIIWHGHEMIYGFTMAIVAGFILTAGANWTSTKGISGKNLIILFSVWLSGRLMFALSLFKPSIPSFLYLLVDMLFIPALIWALAGPLIKSRQWRNIQFLLVFALLATGNLLIHLASLEVIAFTYANKGIYLGVNLILLILVIIGGRVVPFFTANAIAGLEIKKYDWLEKAVLISICSYVFLDFVEYETGHAGQVALIAAAFSFVRMLGWKSWKTIKYPILWVLHLGYLWIVAGLILIFLSDILSLLPRSVAIHAFTAGAMSTFIIGMMSRVSLGHTGRPLRLAKGFVTSYVLITVSGIVRVASGFMPEYYGEGILLSGIFWALGFFIFILFYFSILTSPRADGRPG
ncbi:MAG: NnrS family protein [Bacteriovoracaceae bacterium]|nr:NnrS family protein [Bacteriovoracaceae bacterium]